MTLALVTGGTGFIGAHVVRALRDEGVDVRVLVRSGSDDRNLRGLRVHTVAGDLRDAASLERALAGVDVLFHVAAHYALGRKERATALAVNVGGTQSLMRAALRAGVARVVHTSSVATVGHVRADGAAADERDQVDTSAFAGPYEESKWGGEQAVLALVRSEGLPAVVVNPSAPIGSLDVRPTPTGALIRDVALGRMPGSVRGSGLNLVSVRDVARGHVLAWQRGRVGERYILGHAAGNLSLEEVMRRTAAAAGRRPPRWVIPWRLALAAAYADEYALSRLRRGPVRAPVAGVRLARHRMWFDPSKAVRELGLPQSELEGAIAEAVGWFLGEAGR